MALESRPRAEVLNVQALRGIAATLVVFSHVAERERSLPAAAAHVLVSTIGSSVVLYALIEKSMTLSLQQWWKGRHTHAPAQLLATASDDVTETR